MAFALYDDCQPKTQYFDRKSGLRREEYFEQLENSTTVYVGNLSSYTREEQIYELFSKCGQIKKLVIGLNKYKKVPIGFAFVIYYTHKEAAQAVDLISRTKLDNQIIRVDWDIGFKEGRQYGRAKQGGQVRTEFRQKRKQYNQNFNNNSWNSSNKRKYDKYGSKNKFQEDPGPRKWKKNDVKQENDDWD